MISIKLNTDYKYFIEIYNDYLLNNISLELLYSIWIKLSDEYKKIHILEIIKNDINNIDIKTLEYIKLYIIHNLNYIFDNNKCLVKEYNNLIIYYYLGIIEKFNNNIDNYEFFIKLKNNYNYIYDNEFIDNIYSLNNNDKINMIFNILDYFNDEFITIILLRIISTMINYIDDNIKCKILNMITKYKNHIKILFNIYIIINNNYTDSNIISKLTNEIQYFNTYFQYNNDFIDNIITIISDNNFKFDNKPYKNIYNKISNYVDFLYLLNEDSDYGFLYILLNKLQIIKQIKYKKTINSLFHKEINRINLSFPISRIRNNPEYELIINDIWSKIYSNEQIKYIGDYYNFIPIDEIELLYI